MATVRMPVFFSNPRRARGKRPSVMHVAKQPGLATYCAVLMRSLKSSGSP